MADLCIEIEDYREVGERIVGCGAIRGAGMSSQIEVASEFAVLAVVGNSQIMVLDTYDNCKAALEAAGFSEWAISQENVGLIPSAHEAANHRGAVER